MGQKMLISKENSKTYGKVCKLCKKEMWQIPIRKLDSLMMVEYYCPDCELSEFKYEDFEQL